MTTDPQHYDILKERPLTLRQIIAVVVFACVSTFTLSMIYSRFMAMENEIKRVDDKIEYQTERIGRIKADLQIEIDKKQDLPVKTEK